jgi:hypothetical protein
MPNVRLFGRYAFIVGAAGLILFVVLGLLSRGQVALQSYPSIVQANEDSCAYDEALATLHDTQGLPERTASERRRKDAALARALDRLELAGACEERARSRSDLAAQWYNAVAARNMASLTEGQRYFALAEIFALLATVFAALAALWDSRRHAEVSLRAYLSVKSDDVVLQPLVAGKAVRYKVTLVNTGQTPARKVVTLHTETVRSLPLARDAFAADMPENPPARMNLGAGSELYLTKGDAIIDQTDIDLIKAKRAALFVFGLVTYEDVFGRQHRMTFRLKHDGTLGENGMPMVFNAQDGAADGEEDG